MNHAEFNHRGHRGHGEVSTGLDWVCMSDLGKMLVVAGALAILAGAGLMLAGRAHIPLGRLPGDIVYRGKNSTFYFPLATSLLVSVVLSVVLYLIGRFRH